MWSKAKDVFKSARPYLWPATAANVFVISMSIGTPLFSAAVLGASLCFLASFGFIVNDLWDRDVDCLNSSGRLEHADYKTLILAVLASLLFLLAGLGLAALLGERAFLVSVLISLGLVFYTAIVRRILLAATALSALLGTSPVWVPLLLSTTENPSLAWRLVAAVCMLFAAREIVLDVKDEKGDRKVRRHTFATVFGSEIAKGLSFMVMLVGGFFLVSTVLEGSRGLGVNRLLFLWLGAALFLALNVLPGLMLLNSKSDDGAIGLYVSRTRLGMLIVPLLMGMIVRP